MKASSTDPRRLDVAALCRAAATVDGEWAVPQLERLAGLLAPFLQDDAVAWSVHGELRARAGSAPERWLRVRADTRVVLPCQRCLEPVRQALSVDRSILLVDGEDEAARLDEELEDDVLAMPARLDCRELIEDELILALPLVPRHEACEAPPAPAEPQERQRPFEVLARLRKPG